MCDDRCVPRARLLVIGLVAGCRLHFDAQTDAAGNSGDNPGLGDGGNPGDGTQIVPGGPIAFVQNANAACGAVSQCAQGLPSAILPGSMLIVTTTFDNTSVGIASVTDSAGNTYVEQIAPTNWQASANRTTIWTTRYAGSGETVTVTVTYTATTSSFASLYVDEYANATAVDQTAVNIGLGSGSTCTSGFRSTTFPNEMIFGHGESAGGTIGLGAGFTERFNASTVIEEDFAATQPTFIDAHFRLQNGTEYIAMMISLR